VTTVVTHKFICQTNNTKNRKNNIYLPVILLPNDKGNKEMTKKYAPQRRVKLLVQLEDKIINVQWSNSTPVTAFYPYFCFYVCNPQIRWPWSTAKHFVHTCNDYQLTELKVDTACSRYQLSCVTVWPWPLTFLPLSLVTTNHKNKLRCSVNRYVYK